MKKSVSTSYARHLQNGDCARISLPLRNFGPVPFLPRSRTPLNRKETMETLISLENVSKVFITDEVETHALAGIRLDIRKGEYLSIEGPSGCGKSTLLAILGLLDTPSSGSYTLNGKPVANLNLQDRARIRNREIGFIFQAFNLIGDLSVYENVELPLTYRGMPGSERKKAVLEALEKVQMSHRVKHYPSQLSGGQQQRVAVARALAGNPSVLLADEPTGNLDSVNGEAVMTLLQELHRGGATICMVTHDPRYANFAQRSIHLFDGKIVEERVCEAGTIHAPGSRSSPSGRFTPLVRKRSTIIGGKSFRPLKSIPVSSRPNRSWGSMRSRTSKWCISSTRLKKKRSRRPRAIRATARTGRK